MGKNRLKTVTAGRLVYGVCYSQPSISDRPEERAAKTKVSSAARQRMNFRAAWQKLELEMAANFGRRDLFVTLTYDEAHLPANRAAAIDYMRRFLRRLRAQYKKRGAELKYIYTTEELPDEPGGSARLHHHMIVTACGGDAERLQSLWAAGQVFIEPLLDSQADSYEARARYMVKERQPGIYGRKTGLRAWTPSRNLSPPDITTELVPDSVTITAPPGAFVLERYGDSNYFGSYLYIKYLLPEPRRRRGRP